MTASTTGAVVTLPLDGQLSRYELGEPGAWQRPTRPITSRIAYAAAHVIPNSLADNVPGGPADLDWDATMAYRHELWSYGLGVADAMDTAQRGMGLDWPATRELIRRSGREAASVGGRLACGAGTDQLDVAGIPSGPSGLAAITDAYREQIEVVREAGADVVLMASRALAQVAASADDYLSVYGALLAEADRPMILHWLGEMFDPALRGYWGATETAVATTTFLQLIAAHPGKVDGVKVSLLDAGHEVALRRALPPGVRLYTGDDFNYPELISATSRATPTRCSACSRRSIRPRRRLCNNSRRATPQTRGTSSTRRVIWVGTSSPRPRITTRPESRSCPG